MPSLWSARVQLPVGFGGFHVGAVGSFHRGWPPFVLTFDCGALTQQLACDWATRVARRLSAEVNQVDLAVLSHTDFDHVCGIEALAKAVHVDTLMLPLLSWRFLAAQRAAHAGGRPRWYDRFLRDPVGWANELGVRRVLLVGEAPPDAEPVAGEPRIPPDADQADRRPTLVYGRSARAGADAHAGTTIISSGDVLTVRFPGAPVAWNLIPILAPPKDPEGLNRALAKETSSLQPSAVYAGLSIKKRGSLRNRLAHVYRRHWGSTNRSSIMLLVAPSHGTGGWLCTGDADLTAREGLELLRRYGARYFAGVDAVHVPHHGSPHNFNAAAAAFLVNLAGGRSLKWIISSGKNQWKYPAQSVEAACVNHGTLEKVLPGSSWSDMLRF